MLYFVYIYIYIYTRSRHAQVADFTSFSLARHRDTFGSYLLHVPLDINFSGTSVRIMHKYHVLSLENYLMLVTIF